MTYLFVCAVVVACTLAIIFDRTPTPALARTTTAPPSHVRTTTTAPFDWAESEAA